MIDPFKQLRNLGHAVGRYLTSVTGGNSALAKFLSDAGDGRESDSGIRVDYPTALTYSTIWQAVNCIAGDVGQLPLDVCKKTRDGRERAPDHPAYRLLKRRPNPWMSAGTFRETLQAHALLAGNGRAGIVRDRRARPVQLVPFLPDRSREELKDGALWHVTRMGRDMHEAWFRDEDVLHIKGLGYDGITGYDVVTYARNSIGLGLAQQKHGNRTFRNQAVPSVVLETAGNFTREAALQTLADWQDMVSGMDNVGRTALLQRGVTAKTLSLTNKNAEWLASRQFQRQEIASWFNLPPHKVGDDSKVAYNSLEQENQSYLNSALMRWLKAWEEECFEKLLTEEEKESDSYYVEFNTGALLRGDQLSRYQAYQIGRVNEFLSANDVRAFENMNRVPSGDKYVNPNTKPAPAAAGKPDPAKKAVVGRLAGMIRVECSRVHQAAANPKTFENWCEQFYARWAVRLGEVIEELGGDESEARAYCDASWDQLSKLCETATPAMLAQDVARACANWEQRAELLANSIIKSEAQLCEV